MITIDSPLTLEFNQVTFGYEPGQPVLHNFSAVFRPGTSTAVAGPTGTGKTTIIRLMLALIRPDQGQVNLVAADGSVYPDTSATRVLSAHGRADKCSY